MEKRAAAAALGADALGQHVDHGVEIAARQIGVAIGAANEREQIVFLPVLGGGHGDDLLAHHVQRRRRDQQAIELTLQDRAYQRGAFDQLVARRREDPPLRLGRVLDLMSRPADALQRNGDRSWRSDLADEIHGADVDAELERRGGDNRLQLSGFELLFGGQPQLAGQAAVMGEHRVFAKPLGQMMGDALGQPPRVHEDEGRPVFLNQRGDAVVDLLPHLVRRDRPELVLRHLNREIHRAAMTVVDDVDLRVLVGREEARDDLNRPYRCRETDPLRTRTAGLLHQIVEPRERQRQVRAALVVGHRVNLVDDHRLDAAQRLPAAIGREQNEE